MLHTLAFCFDSLADLEFGFTMSQHPMREGPDSGEEEYSWGQVIYLKWVICDLLL